MSRNDKMLSSVNGAIAHTPLVELKRITKNLEGKIFAKIEYLNPGFSKKDRIARQIIEDVEGHPQAGAACSRTDKRKYQDGVGEFCDIVGTGGTFAGCAAGTDVSPL